MRYFCGFGLALAIMFGLGSGSTFADDYKCVYVAKTQYGTGKRIQGTRGVGTVHYGRNAPTERKIKKRLKACTQARNQCKLKLSLRKIQGKNPKARCVVVRIKRN